MLYGLKNLKNFLYYHLCMKFRSFRSFDLTEWTPKNSNLNYVFEPVHFRPLQVRNNSMKHWPISIIFGSRDEWTTYYEFIVVSGQNIDFCISQCSIVTVLR